jgi:hypothetical protein
MKPKRAPTQLAQDVEDWIRSLPIDPGEALERVGSEVADLVPGRRRSRDWTAVMLPAVVAAVTFAAVAAIWVLAHRGPTAAGSGVEAMVPDADEFDRDAVLRAEGEGMGDAMPASSTPGAAVTAGPDAGLRSR